MNLKITVDLSGKSGWLSEKYDVMLRAAVRATRQLSESQLDEQVPWRDWTLRKTILHVLSFPELAWLSHKHGSMSTDDMRVSDERLISAVGGVSSTALIRPISGRNQMKVDVYTHPG